MGLPSDGPATTRTRLDTLDDRELTLLRRKQVGFVFQFYNLLPVLTAEQNITLPVRIGGDKPDVIVFSNMLTAGSVPAIMYLLAYWLSKTNQLGTAGTSMPSGPVPFVRS